MSRLRFLIPVLLFAVIFMIAGFRQSESIKKDAKTNYSKKFDPPYAYCFKYIGPVSFNYATLIDPNNYELINISDPNWELCDFGSEALCAILCERYWDGFEWRPNFDAAPYPGSTKQQLYSYSQSGWAGMALYLKDL